MEPDRAYEALGPPPKGKGALLEATSLRGDTRTQMGLLRILVAMLVSSYLEEVDVEQAAR